VDQELPDTVLHMRRADAA